MAFDAFCALEPKHALSFVIPAKAEIQIRNVPVDCVSSEFCRTPHEAGAKKLARLIREYRGIENRLHHVKDRTFLEDRHCVKNRTTAHVFTFLRSLAVGLLHSLKIPGRGGRVFCPETIEYVQADTRRALRIVRGETGEK